MYTLDMTVLFMLDLMSMDTIIDLQLHVLIIQNYQDFLHLIIFLLVKYEIYWTKHLKLLD